MNPTAPPASSLGPDEIAAIRACHRGTRNAGYVACLLGVLAMIAGRFAPWGPMWLTSLGLAVVIFGWGLLALAFVRRVALTRYFLSR